MNDSSTLKKHHERIEFLREYRAAMEAGGVAQDHNASIIRTGGGFIYTEGGRRDFVFPALPDVLDTQVQIDLCSAWIEKELTSRGMLCDFSLFEDGPIFSCPLARLGPKVSVK